MTANEIRTKFLEFFKSKGHTIVASDSVVPKDDPTVLFTTAGMQQFKRQFLGHIDGYTRATSSQKCLRTDDLDKVGKTPYHHTFFEMLGNFSFGDYFKKKAIEWAWEFLIKEMKISENKLWVSVYKDDDEAYDIWLKDIKVPREKIIKLGDKDNFWPAEAKEKGPNGPCGPCSEIFYDYGLNPDCKNKNCDPSCNCGRFTEIWNLVFTQFNRKEGGVLEPLPNKNIDTGMGLERLVAVVQGKKSNYETDLFEPILKAIDDTIKGITKKDRLLIADHIRAIVFGINDGIIPSNEKQGYVIKKLIVTVTDITVLHGATRPTIWNLVEAVVETMKEAYPELNKSKHRIKDIILKVETDYLKGRQETLPQFKEEIIKVQYDPIKIGETLFKFHDTFGVTMGTADTILINEIKLPQASLTEAMEKYNRLMENQQNRSRAASKMTGDVFADIELNLTNIPKTKFIGYEYFEGKGKNLKLFVDDKEVNQISTGDHVKVILEQTPFYAEAGGQIGDSGYLTCLFKGQKVVVRILDTKKQDDVYIHIGKVESGTLYHGVSVTAQVDTERRLSIMRNHTATHLLQSALREILGSHVQQQGSLVAEDRLRFDFTHPKAVTKEQLMQIENTINERISRNDKVTKEEMSLEEAKKKGALAFFAEKYKDIVRVISIGNYSKEFCGGTHLDSTGEIGQFIISSEGAVAQGIRRLEAKTGNWAIQFIKEREAKELEQKQSEEKRLQEFKEKKEADQRRWESFKNNLKTIIDKADSVNSTKIITCTFTDADANQLKSFSDLIKQRIPSVAICLGSTPNGSASVIVGVSGDLIKKGIKANELIKDIAPLINGSGGGRPDLAQAGSKEPAKLNSALQQASSIIKKKLKQ